MMNIVKNGIYFTNGLKNLVISTGGQFGDTKERPIVALIQSRENPEIYWAIPIGDLSHRDQSQIDRINTYINYTDNDIRSCFYHIGNTNKKTIFFISDVLPVQIKYITREYLVGNKQHYVIKNVPLLLELERKFSRILAWEQSKIAQTGTFFFRQNIYGVYAKIKEELEDI